MKFQSFEEIVAWQKAQDLAVDVYQIFSANRDFGFLNQIRDAVVSISNNIAEGYERSSDADFCRFLFYSLGSSSEVKSMLYLAKRLNYISEEQNHYLITQTSEVSRIIKGLIKFLNK
jgi:four helix bundle protein